MATRTNQASGQGDASEAPETTKAGLPVAVTLEGLQKDYGKAEGRRMFRDISVRGGFGDILAGSHEHDNPSLDLSGLKGDNLKAVEEVFAGATPKGKE